MRTLSFLFLRFLLRVVIILSGLYNHYTAYFVPGCSRAVPVWCGLLSAPPNACLFPRARHRAAHRRHPLTPSDHRLRLWGALRLLFPFSDHHHRHWRVCCSQLSFAAYISRPKRGESALLGSLPRSLSLSDCAPSHSSAIRH